MPVWSLIFFWSTVSVVMLALLSQKSVLELLSFVLAASFGVTIIAWKSLQHPIAADIFAIADPLCGLYVGWLVVRFRSLTAVFIFALFFALVATHWVAFGEGLKGSHTHMLLLDVLFALQLLSVGGASCAEIIRCRLGVVLPGLDSPRGNDLHGSRPGRLGG